MREEALRRGDDDCLSRAARLIFRVISGAILSIALLAIWLASTGGGGITVCSPASSVRGGLESYKIALLMYQKANGFLPTTEQGLKALFSKPDSEPQPTRWRQIMDSAIKDPWRQEYFYLQPGEHHRDGYDLFSAGPDRKAGTSDDIGNWENPH